MKRTVCRTQASFRRPVFRPAYCHPAADMMEWISRDGITMIRRIRSKKTVIWRAKPRAAGLMASDISQRTSSANTAASATVAEKVKADTRLMGFPEDMWLDFVGDDGRELNCVCRSWEPYCPFFKPTCPESSGKSFWKTTVATKRKVTRNGKDEKITVVGSCVLRWR